MYVDGSETEINVTLTSGTEQPIQMEGSHTSSRAFKPNDVGLDCRSTQPDRWEKEPMGISHRSGEPRVREISPGERARDVKGSASTR